MDLENEMIPQIIKVKADNKMKNILYYLNGDKKCETLLFYHFLFRLSLLSKRGLQHWELLLHCSREYLLRTLFLFFFYYIVQKNISFELSFFFLGILSTKNLIWFLQCQFPKAPRNNSHKKKSYIQNPKRIKSRNKDGEIRNKINLYEHQSFKCLTKPERIKWFWKYFSNTFN